MEQEMHLFREQLKAMAQIPPLQPIPFSSSALGDFVTGKRVPSCNAVIQIARCYPNDEANRLLERYIAYQDSRYDYLRKKAEAQGFQDPDRLVVCSRTNHHHV